MSIYILNKALTQVIGYVGSMAVAEKIAKGNLIVAGAECLKAFSDSTLTALILSIEPSLEIDAKDDLSILAFETLQETDQSVFLKLDDQAVEAAKPRKVRDSKLQRMAKAFKLQEPDGTYKKWTIEELMKHSDTTKRIASVYISILRSTTDRFNMAITKCATNGTYQFTPEMQ